MLVCKNYWPSLRPCSRFNPYPAGTRRRPRPRLLPPERHLRHAALPLEPRPPPHEQLDLSRQPEPLHRPRGALVALDFGEPHVEVTIYLGHWHRPRQLPP